MFSNENESCFFCVEVNKIKKKSLKYTALHFKVFQCFWNQSFLSKDIDQNSFVRLPLLSFY